MIELIYLVKISFPDWIDYYREQLVGPPAISPMGNSPPFPNVPFREVIRVLHNGGFTWKVVFKPFLWMLTSEEWRLLESWLVGTTGLSFSRTWEAETPSHELIMSLSLLQEPANGSSSPGLPVWHHVQSAPV